VTAGLVVVEDRLLRGLVALDVQLQKLAFHADLLLAQQRGGR
jgi:hypothetical protein